MKNIFLKRAFIFLLSMVTLLSALPTLSLPVSAATSWPSLSTSSYCEYVVPGNADVYCDAALKTRGASGKSYNAYIAAGDVIKVYEVTSSYTYLEYPTSSGMKTGYAKTSSLFGVSYPVEKIVSSGKVTTYQTPAENNQSGYVAKNDTVFIVAGFAGFKAFPNTVPIIQSFPVKPYTDPIHTKTQDTITI